MLCCFVVLHGNDAGDDVSIRVATRRTIHLADLLQWFLAAGSLQVPKNDHTVDRGGDSLLLGVQVLD